MAKKILVLSAVLCLAAFVAWAGEGHGKMDAASHAAKLKAELNLNADQTAKVESILADFMKKMEPIHAKAEAAHEQLKALRGANAPDSAAIKAKEDELANLRAQKQALSAERDAALKKVLTTEQYAKYEQRAAAHAKEPRGPGHPK